jgi:uncharacterized membrane protein YkvA (DUF1232 family)
MAQAGKQARRFAQWASELPADIEGTFALLTNEAVGTQGRRFLAGGLSYILTQLDIIPDHEKAGAVDDCFVLRVAYGLAAEHAAKVGTAEASRIAKMTNEEDDVRGFLGDALFAKLRRHVVELADKPVRGRTTDQILTDAKLRGDMKRELDQSVKKSRQLLIDNDQQAEALEVSIQSYFKMKLGG